jgi:hypothetical protein
MVANTPKNGSAYRLAELPNGADWLRDALDSEVIGPRAAAQAHAWDELAADQRSDRHQQDGGREYVRRAGVIGITWPVPEAIDDAELVHPPEIRHTSRSPTRYLCVHRRFYNRTAIGYTSVRSRCSEKQLKLTFRARRERACQTMLSLRVSRGGRDLGGSLAFKVFFSKGFKRHPLVLSLPGNEAFAPCAIARALRRFHQ